MWLELCLSFLMSWFSGTSDNQKNHSDMNDMAFEFQVGDWFKDFSSETIELLNHSGHKDVYISNSSNSDSCWVYSNACKLDSWHHIYYVPMTQHKGHFYVVTFSINYHVLNVENTWSHAS